MKLFSIHFHGFISDIYVEAPSEEVVREALLNKRWVIWKLGATITELKVLSPGEIPDPQQLIDDLKK